MNLKIINKSKIKLIILIVILILVFTGCKEEVETTITQDKAITVLDVKETSHPCTVDYIGVVSSDEIIKYSFKMPGKIASINFEVGEKVKAGDILATMDTTDLEYQLSAAKATLEMAKLAIDQASEASEYTNSLYTKLDNLYKNGAITKDQYEQIQMQKEINNSSYSQAQQQYNVAKADYDYKKDLLENAVIYAKEDGTVAMKLFNPNENVGAYMPVIAVMSDNQIVNVGIPQNEFDLVKVGNSAIVTIDGKEVEGTVSNISKVPDEDTMTYKAEITLNNTNFQLGATAKVSIDIGNKKGIWIPMSVVAFNGENYVYVLKEDRVFTQIITIKENIEDKLLVEGLSEGDKIVLTGMKNLYDGAKVVVVNQGGDYE